MRAKFDHCGRIVAAGASVAIHALLIAAALGLAGYQVNREEVRPIEVALVRPPEQLPVVPPPPPPPPPKPQPKPAARAPEPVRAAPPAPPPPPSAAQPAPAPGAAPAAPPPPAGADAAPSPAAVAGRASASASAGSDRGAPPAPATSKTAPRADASWTGNTPPPYPALARRLGEEGEVRLDVHVRQDGTVDEVRLKKSSGSPLLDQTAIDTVKKWRFKPATVDGKPVDEWYYNWKWVFRLES